MDEHEIERLLYSGESDELDFKRDQYPLTNNDEKGELIKDILAMVNSWRTTDAYILIGVDENKVAGMSTPVGVSTHLKDSDLQQMVNSKTNELVSFSYKEESYKGFDLGVIHIPVQDRPRFLTRDFGRLKKDIVYVRRSSSTAEAGLDEILKMRSSRTSPNLDLQFADLRNREQLGTVIPLTSTVVEYDDNDIPLLYFSPLQAASITGNQKYLKQKAAYIAATELLNPVGFCLKNSASTLATNIRLELSVGRTSTLKIIDEYEYPRYPQRESRLFAPLPNIINTNAHVDVFGNNLVIKVSFGNIQPGDTAWSKGKIYIGAVVRTDLNLNGHLYGDNLARPIPISLKVKVDATKRALKLEEVKERK